MRTVVLASATSIIVLGSLLACQADPCSSGECIPPGHYDEAGADGATADGGGATDADGDANVITPPGCNLAVEPKAAPECVAESIGLFVSATGSDEGDGSKGKPFRSIAKALASATNQRFRVYVCEGTYAEALSFGRSTSLYGGFSCTNWAYTGKAAKVAPAKQGYAAQFTGVTNVEVADVMFESQAASAAGASSIAAFLNNSKVSFRRVSFDAGAGADGEPGAPFVSNLFSADPNDLRGNPAMGAVAGGPKTCVCKTFGQSVGGGAGIARQNGSPGSAAPTNPNVAPAGAGGAGWLNNVACSGGISGTAGAPAAATLTPQTHGAFVSGVWTPTVGAAGAVGNPGGGGGGGGGGEDDPSGGGGCGGCGGAGGGGGRGGGASIGIVALASTVSLDACSLRVGKGGVGGDGMPGESGGVGGGGNFGACSGGKGGGGGAGGGGGGGAGGLSVGVLYSGPAPIVVDPKFVGGTAGAGGTGGAGGAGGPKGDDGKPGVVAETLSL
jgi:hypothetical protein